MREIDRERVAVGGRERKRVRERQAVGEAKGDSLFAHMATFTLLTPLLLFLLLLLLLLLLPGNKTNFAEKHSSSHLLYRNKTRKKKEKYW